VKGYLQKLYVQNIVGPQVEFISGRPEARWNDAPACCCCWWWRFLRSQL